MSPYIDYYLKNGMRIILVPQEAAKSIAIGFFTKAGSRYETPNINGISHFLEHMMFKSTQKRKSKKLLTDLDKLGAYYNAGTSYEYTYYEVNGNAKDVIELLDIMIDLYCNPLMLLADIKTEKGVVIEEIKMGKDDPEDNLYQYLHQLLYSGSSLEMSIAGDEKTVAKLTRSQIQEYRKKHYIPSNSVLCLVGKFSETSVKKIIEKQLGKLPAQKSLSLPKYYLLGKTENQSTAQIKFRNSILSQVHMVLSFRGVSLNDKRKYALSLISTLLSSGSTSRLFDLLRTKMGAVYSVSADQYNGTDHGRFDIYAGVDAKKIVDAIRGILKVIQNIKQEKISREELHKAIKIKETSLVLGLTSPDAYLSYYGYQGLFKQHLKNPEKEIQKITSLTPTDINCVANTIFEGDKMNLVIHGNITSAQKKQIVDLVEYF